MNSQNNFSKSIHLENYKKILPDFKNKKTQVYTTLILTFIALSFFGIFAISPTLSTIAELNKKLDDSRYLNSKLEEKIKNLSLLQQQYNLIQEDLKVIDSALPDSAKVPIFIGQVETITNLNNVKLSRVNTSSVELSNVTTTSSNKSLDYLTFSFSLSVEGDYRNVNNFVTDISNFERIITIDSLSIRKKENAYQVDLSGKAYFKN